MESVLVNARVSRAKKETAAGILEALGSTTSELINSAYDYLLEHRSLPASEGENPRSHEAFAAFEAESTLGVDWGAAPESFDYKSFMRAEKRGDYESLA